MPCQVFDVCPRSEVRGAGGRGANNLMVIVQTIDGSGASADAEADLARSPRCGFLGQSSLPLLLEGPLLWSTATAKRALPLVDPMRQLNP